MATSQLAVMHQARDLADKLAGATTAVKANTLRSILADFMASQVPGPAELRRLLQALEADRGGQLARGGNFADQALAAIPILESVLDESELGAVELKTLFGWTARLLLVRGLRGQARQSSVPVKKKSTKVRARPLSDKPEELVWKQAVLTWIPGQGRLEAKLGTLRAHTQNRELLAALPEDARNRLTRKKKRKSLNCEASVLKRGESWYELMAVRVDG